MRYSPQHNNMMSISVNTIWYKQPRIEWSFGGTRWIFILGTIPWKAESTHRNKGPTTYQRRWNIEAIKSLALKACILFNKTNTVHDYKIRKHILLAISLVRETVVDMIDTIRRPFFVKINIEINLHYNTYISIILVK